MITVEHEKNGHLAFILDLNVYRTIEEKLEIDVHCKLTHTNKSFSCDTYACQGLCRIVPYIQSVTEPCKSRES